MPVKQSLYNQLKNLGTMPWQKVVAEGLYNEHLLLNKLPSVDFIAGETSTETISNRKEGYMVDVVLDLDFLKAKMLRHICKYFKSTQKEDYLKFCNEVWESHCNADLEKIANSLVATMGGTKAEWLKKIHSMAK